MDPSQAPDHCGMAYLGEHECPYCQSESAFGAFYLHLERNNAELLTFSADNKFETIRSWLAEEDLIKI